MCSSALDPGRRVHVSDRVAAGWLAGLAILLGACGAEAPPSEPPPETVSPSAGAIGDGGISADTAGEPVDFGAEPLFDAALSVALETAVEEAIVLFGIPGAAVAVVEGEEIVLSRTFGFRHVRRRLPISEETLFRIGAVTRPLTATMMASLADEDRLEWPRLASWDPSSDGSSAWERTFATDALASASASSSEDSSARAAYRLAMQNRLFGPAGMMRTAITDRLPAMADDFATPYATDLEGELVEGEFPEAGRSAPVDGGASTADDLARFLVLHLGGGIDPEGNRVASESNLERTRSERGTSACTGRPLASRCGQSLGWQLAELADGSSWFEAEGGREGFSALVGYLEGPGPARDDRDPSREGLGLVVLTNLDSRLGGLDFVREVRDAFLVLALGLEAPASSVHLAHHLEQRQQLERLAAGSRPVPPSAVRPFLGRYAEGWSLALTGSRVELRHELRSFPIRSYAGEGYLVAHGPKVGHPVRFEMGPEGPIMWLPNQRGEPERFAKLE